MNLMARLRTWKARRNNTKTGKVTSGRADSNERSAMFHRTKLGKK